MYSPPPTKQTETSLRWGVDQNTITIAVPEWAQHDPSKNDWVALERCEAYLWTDKLEEELLEEELEGTPSRLRAAEEALAEARKRLRFIEWLASDIDAIPEDELRIRSRRQRWLYHASLALTPWEDMFPG